MTAVCLKSVLNEKPELRVFAGPFLRVFPPCCCAEFSVRRIKQELQRSSFKLERTLKSHRSCGFHHGEPARSPAGSVWPSRHGAGGGAVTFW